MQRLPDSRRGAVAQPARSLPDDLRAGGPAYRGLPVPKPKTDAAAGAPAQVDQLVAAASGRRLVLLTNHCPYCSWTPSNNAVIEAGCTPARRCSVADWNGLAGANPQWFGRDGVHMPIGGTGGQAYAELVARDL